MRLSVITSTYNSARTLAANIASARSQSFSNWEHIFIDAFSTDGSQEILAAYQSEFPDRVKIFSSPPAGISAAMNEGVRRATGDYLVHLHSDDSLYDNEVLADVAKFLEARKPDWLYGQINVREENGHSLGLWPAKKLWQGGGASRLGRYLLKFYNYIPHQAVFIRPQVFRDFGYFDESLSSAMDPDLWLRLQDKTDWVFFPRVISNFSLRSEAASSGRKNRAQAEENACLVRNRYLKPWEKPLSWLIRLLLAFKDDNYR